MVQLTTENFKEILKEELEEGFESQARLINNAFQGQKDHFDKQFAAVRKDIKSLDERITVLEGEVKALSAKVTTYLALSDKRYLELKRREMILAKWVKQIADKTGVKIDLEELEKI